MKPELARVDVGPLHSSPLLVSQFDMSISLHEWENRIKGGLVYATSLFERSTVERYAGYYERLIEGMVAGGGSRRMHQIGILADALRQQVVYEFNRTEAEIPAGYVHELFEEQVKKRPEATALVYRGLELSYGELNRRANQVAYRLLSLGIKPDDRVAISVERGPEMVVGLLGVLKAAAYVPLDPAYPEERVNYMLAVEFSFLYTTRSSLDLAFKQSARLPTPTLCNSVQGRRHLSGRPLSV
jgi:non-ribosomal peptide synthetase component F